MKKYAVIRNGKEIIKDNPFDLLDEQSLFNDEMKENDFFEMDVEKKVSVKLGLTNLFNLGIEYIKKETLTVPDESTENLNDKDDARIGSSGSYARIGSSGSYARIGSSGSYARIGSSGYDARIGSSGSYARIGSSGNAARIGSSGCDARIGSSGCDARIGSSGYDARIGSSGNAARIGSSGCDARIGSSGYDARIGSSGNAARIGSSGCDARIGSSGSYARINTEGQHSIAMAAGRHSIFKGINGSWFSLAEYKFCENLRRAIPYFVKSAQIGNKDYVDYKGKVLKEDTFYQLINKEFVPVVEIDGIRSVFKSKITQGQISIYICYKLDDYMINTLTKEYIAVKGEYSAHGQTKEQAIRDLNRKIEHNKPIEERVQEFKEKFNNADKYLNEELFEWHGILTLSCETGRKYYIEQNNIDLKDSMTIKEFIQILKTDGYTLRYADSKLIPMLEEIYK